MYRLLCACTLVTLLLAGCRAAGPSAPLFTEDIGLDLLWRYDAPHIPPEEKRQLVTGQERAWYEQQLADRQAGRQPTHSKDWGTTGAVVQVDRVSTREAYMKLQYSSKQSGGQTVVILFRFVPENGVWKIENHQLPNGTWWKPLP